MRKRLRIRCLALVSVVLAASPANAAAGSVAGTVIGPGGAGVAGVVVEAHRADFPGYKVGATGGDGTYAIGDLPTGTYKLFFAAGSAGYASEWFSDKASQAEADTVTVSASIATVVNASLTDGGGITGSVSVGGVIVSLFDEGKNFLASVVTSPGGSFAFVDLSSGSYYLFFDGSALGYVPEWLHDGSGPSAVAVVAPSLTGSVNAVLSPGGSITGTVDGDTGGLTGAKVLVYSLADEPVDTVFTAAGGGYSVRGLATGDYKVLFDAATLGYMPEWLADKGDAASADTVHVEAPAETSAVNAVLVRWGGIAGTVTGPGGSGAGGVAVSVYDGSLQLAGTATTSADGTFAVGGLGPDDYTVLFDGSSSGLVTRWYGSPVTVAPPSISGGIGTELEYGGSIAGTARGSSGGALVGATVALHDVAAILPPQVMISGPAGGFLFPGVANGSYHLFVNGAGGDLGGWYDGVTSATSRSGAATITVASTDPVTGKDVTLVLGGSIAGTVSSSAPAPLAGIGVRAYDADGIPVGSAETAADGAYRIGGLPDGAYRLEFTDDFGLHVGEWYDDKASFGEATTVAVTVSQTSSGKDAVLADAVIEPSACFARMPEHALCGEQVSFDAACSSAASAAGRSIARYEWDFDFDGASFTVDATGATATHAYAAFGAYTVALRITDDGGPAGIDIETLGVAVDQGNREPVADAGGPYTVTVGSPLALDGMGSADPDAGCGDGIATWRWDLDDDQDYGDASGPTPTVAWSTLAALGISSPGTYAINLGVTDSFGSPDMHSTTVTVVKASPVAKVSTRGKVTAANPLQAGFTLFGESKRVVVRGLGPTLGIAGALANPVLRVYAGTTLVGSNDNWGSLSAVDRAVLTVERLTPGNAYEAALVLTLPGPGPYTVRLSGGTGIGQVEVYDTDAWGN